MKLVVTMTLVGLVGSARADDDPFAMLRERGRAWTFELVSGPSIAKLVPVKGAPQARCQVVELAAVGAITRSRIECAALAEATGEIAAALAQRFTLAFEPAGVRETVNESDEPAVVGEASNAGAFTFPRKLTKRWSYDVKRPDGAQAVVVVHDEPAVVRGAPGSWWIAEASHRPATPGGVVVPPVRAAAAFAPGVGPALKCTDGGKASATRYTCLRLIADPPPPPIAPLAPPKPKPIATIAITGKTAHNKSSLSAAAVAGKIAASYVPAIRRCYGELLRKKPAAAGTLQLDFTVNAVGKLAEPAAKSAALEPVASCVRGAMAGWQFAIPQSEYGEPRTARFVIDLRLAPPAR